MIFFFFFFLIVFFFVFSFQLQHIFAWIGVVTFELVVCKFSKNAQILSKIFLFEKGEKIVSFQNQKCCSLDSYHSSFSCLFLRIQRTFSNQRTLGGKKKKVKKKKIYVKKNIKNFLYQYSLKIHRLNFSLLPMLFHRLL